MSETLKKLKSKHQINKLKIPWKNDVCVKHTKRSAKQCGININSDLKENVVDTEEYDPQTTNKASSNRRGLMVKKIMLDNYKINKSQNNGVQK